MYEYLRLISLPVTWCKWHNNKMASRVQKDVQLLTRDPVPALTREIDDEF